MNFDADILVHSITNGSNCMYFSVPCFITIEENFPNSETSYILNIQWSKYEKREGIPPKDGYPNYPSYSEYKSYFNSMKYFNYTNFLEFRNVWHENTAIYIFKHSENKDNYIEMQELARNWEH